MKRFVLAFAVSIAALLSAAPVFAADSGPAPSGVETPSEQLVALPASSSSACEAPSAAAATDLLEVGTDGLIPMSQTCQDVSDCPCPDACYCVTNPTTGQKICLCDYNRCCIGGECP